MQPINSENGFLQRFLADDSGATAIEYTVMAAGIALAIIVTVTAVGTTLVTTYYQSVADAFN